MEINLPKKYLSYSQMTLWRQSKDGYRKRYYENGPSFENKETIFGKNTAKMLEDGVAHPVLSRVPRYKYMEYKITVPVLGVPFMGVLDTFSLQKKGFKEYKTGKEPWNAVRVAKHEQLVIYSLLIKLKHKKVDPYCELVWIGTQWGRSKTEFDGHVLEGQTQVIEFTGKIEIFKRRISEWERKRMAQNIRSIAEEISADYTKWQNEKKHIPLETGQAVT